MTNVRAGYDVTEAMWIPEANFGAIPQTGIWKHFGDCIVFDSVRRPLYKPRIGIGRQYPKELVMIREFAELNIEINLLKEDETEGEEHEWLELYVYMWGEDALAATVNLEKHEGPMSIGAKLDLVTDEYLTLVGNKFSEVTLRANLDDPVKLLGAFVAQRLTHGTTDYMQGTASRKTFPTTSYLKLADCEFKYNGASILTRLQSFEFRMRREIDKRGSDATIKTLYAKFSEVGLAMEVSVVLDFDSTGELTDFMGDTTRDIEIHIPAESGGQKITLPTCQWKELRKPIREVDLIELRLVAEVLGTPTITQIT